MHRTTPPNLPSNGGAIQTCRPDDTRFPRQIPRCAPKQLRRVHAGSPSAQRPNPGTLSESHERSSISFSKCVHRVHADSTAGDGAFAISAKRSAGAVFPDSFQGVSEPLKRTEGRLRVRLQVHLSVRQATRSARNGLLCNHGLSLAGQD